MSCQMTWSGFAEERMKTVNVLNEVECFKAIKEVINLYFSLDKGSLDKKIKKINADKDEKISSPLEGKCFGGWNVDYYCQPVDWDIFKIKKA
ncbi:hypothetical protein [Desulfolucanica intricata]|uniref:hypothetical protein n=1 Tax=Desulfolucanica intricata TaxID=1285191 RepID=UPI0008298D24|nr:hypothetical protein [Desulfolucanica intricata]